MDRRLLAGVGAGIVYLLAAFATVRGGSIPTAPVYDGLAPPPPYRYVDPPPDLVDENEPPLRAVGTLELDAEGSRARTVTTADGQMLVVFPDGAVPTREGEEEVEVRITPLDPGPLTEAPGELVISGNAYRVEARYVASDAPVELEEEPTVVLRYPVHGTDMLRLEDGGWTRLPTDRAEASLQLFAETSELGTFAAAAVPESSRAWIAYAAAGAAVVAGVAGYLSGRRRGRRRPTQKRGGRRRRPGRV